MRRPLALLFKAMLESHFQCGQSAQHRLASGETRVIAAGDRGNA